MGAPWRDSRSVEGILSVIAHSAKEFAPLGGAAIYF
jgi:hypothetical protein